MKICKFSDRKQNKPTDPLLVGVYDIDAESYKTIGKLQTMRANYALARYGSCYLSKRLLDALSFSKNQLKLPMFCFSYTERKFA